MVRGLKFRIKVVEGLYYPYSENKGADHLRGYREADMRLCFRIFKNPVISRCGINNIRKSIFMSVVNNFSPIKEVRIKQRTEPWVNAGILQSINDRDRAFKAFEGYKSEQNFATFKDLRNKTRTLIYHAKKIFFQSKLETSNKDSKSL